MQNKSRSWPKPQLTGVVFLALACQAISVSAGGLETAEPDARTVVGERFQLVDKSMADDAIGGRDELFGDIDSSPAPNEKAKKSEISSFKGIKGFLQFEVARSYQKPAHWSKMLTRADLSGQGSLGNGIKWKLGARLDYDAVYGINDFYSKDVANDQRADLTLRENYLDISAGDWDFRLGKQNVVWGEMVGLFFADVVSARDLREYILPEFDTMRIPQWAARAEYFSGDYHTELVWIPVASYDQIGKPGSEFFPGPNSGVQYRNEDIPSRNLRNTDYGVRFSALKGGWDVSGFAYSSMDISPTFYREPLNPPNAIVYQARHDRINQFGGTLAKDFGSVVLKSEGVYTRGRKYIVTRLSDDDGLARQNTLDWAIGLDFQLPADTRFNAQLFERLYFAHDPDLISDAREDGYSLLLNHKLNEKLEVQAMWIASFNRTDWLFRPRLTWDFERNWRLAVGADIFKGPQIGLFGRYDGNDRVYSEVRYSF